MTLKRYGITITLPRGWSGRLWSRQKGAATLHVANFALALDDGQFGDQSTAAMHPRASFFALAEYLPGRGLRPGRGLFGSPKLPLPLDPASLSQTGLAHPRPGQAGMQHFFTAAGRPFCLYVVLAGPRSSRRRQLLEVDHVLRSLRISER